jgi:hypothetical protein
VSFPLTIHEKSAKMSSTKSTSPQNDNNEHGNTPTVLHPYQRPPHDINVSFEEYHHYAQKTRAEESASINHDVEKWSLIDTLLHRKKTAALAASETTAQFSDKSVKEEELPIYLPITDSEWNNASRLMRTATAGSCFYLITTDILGPYGVGYLNFYCQV